MAIALRLRNIHRTLTIPPLVHLFSTSKAASPPKTVTEEISSHGLQEPKPVPDLHKKRKCLPNRHQVRRFNWPRKRNNLLSYSAVEETAAQLARLQKVYFPESAGPTVPNRNEPSSSTPPKEALVDKKIKHDKGGCEIKTSQSDCAQSRVGGISDELRETLYAIAADMDRKRARQERKLSSGSTRPTVSNRNKPSSSPPPKEALVDKKIEHDKGRYEIKMSQSECGSSRVEVALPPGTEKLPKVSKSQRSCSICRKSGHNKRSCPLSHQQGNVQEEGDNL